MVLERPQRLAFAMPLYSFRTHDGERCSASEACELSCRDDAWNELTKICGDLIGGSCHGLRQNSEWSIEALDAANRPVFRIRMVAETLVLPFVLASVLLLLVEPTFVTLLT
jgi:hypothetical protein